ncbi:hypothetical protein TNCV_1297641 [Trichonephila clavipes]|nr:hypothetical protein TNCV_1297641 [Trichonephila clavipes]
MFTRVRQNLAKYGSFRTTIKGTGCLRKAGIPVFEEGALHAVDRNPDTSAWALDVSTEISCPTVLRVLRGKTLLPYHGEKENGSSLSSPISLNRRHDEELTSEWKRRVHHVTCVISVKKVDDWLPLQLVNLPNFRLEVLFSQTQEHLSTVI